MGHAPKTISCWLSKFGNTRVHIYNRLQQCNTTAYKTYFEIAFVGDILFAQTEKTQNK